MAKQEDITLYANMLVIYYDPDAKGDQDGRGHRAMSRSSNSTEGRRARRSLSSRMRIRSSLEGEAVLREGENVIRGDRVIYYMDEERSVVEGGKGGRVNTTITPPKKERKERYVVSLV